MCYNGSGSLSKLLLTLSIALWMNQFSLLPTPISTVMIVSLAKSHIWRISAKMPQMDQFI
jgi:hypothetical protein